eukprot:TRINITY_DN4349_c1_g1_i1.p1 TRINITY_DN4349_c1_g1~~TRINITY_DN4349_c1_g1_i1.p1  ORF type:complete len:132 (+),score=45.51 TRINITY_DN4349_c1_g1_i1:147-542(+)
MSTPAAVQKIIEEYENELRTLKKFDDDISALTAKSQKLLTQKNENIMVKEELQAIKGDARVFKLVGPALIPHPPADALDFVNKRLDFIETELRRTEDGFKALQQKQKEQQLKLVNVQRKLQQNGFALAPGR